ncbi:MAG TPA: putative dsRNA-binding protein, partial [Candidatus Nitrosopolaris sp.]|nr:putative dsRNA-binding protein [Candidatus Nitrosopolaris sp.]
ERARQQILANCFEAVIGALYLDRGYQAAQKYIQKTLLPSLDDILHSGSWMDPKSRLQETAQSREGFTPVYKVLKEEGPDHDKTFVVGVYVDNKLRGEGTGASKQAAQVAAAEAALKDYR